MPPTALDLISSLRQDTKNLDQGQARELLLVLAAERARPGKCLFVDATHGSDTNGARETESAFLTHAAAVSAALVGDIVVTLPGTYTVPPVDCPLSKDGVNHFFYAGASLTVDVGAESAASSIFGNGNYTVYGRGEFLVQGALFSDAFQILLLTGGTSRVSFECESARLLLEEGVGEAPFTSSGHAHLRIVVHGLIECLGYDAVLINSPDGETSVWANRIVAADDAFEVTRGDYYASRAECEGGITAFTGATVRVGRLTGTTCYLDGDVGASIHIELLACEDLVFAFDYGGVTASIGRAECAAVKLAAQGVCSLKNTTLICSGNVSIEADDGTTARSITIMNVFSNKPVAGHVTQQVAAVTVSAAVN